MKKYIAWLNEVTNIEFTQEQFDNCEIKIVNRFNKDIPCKVIITNSKNKKEFFILYPISDFEIKE